MINQCPTDDKSFREVDWWGSLINFFSVFREISNDNHITVS